MSYNQPIFLATYNARGLIVKNWTLRQRILASFAVIIAIMLLMVVAAYSRLMTIEESEEVVRSDSMPGVLSLIHI